METLYKRGISILSKAIEMDESHMYVDSNRLYSLSFALLSEFVNSYAFSDNSALKNAVESRLRQIEERQQTLEAWLNTTSPVQKAQLDIIKYADQAVEWVSLGTSEDLKANKADAVTYYQKGLDLLQLCFVMNQNLGSSKYNKINDDLLARMDKIKIAIAT